MALKGSAIIELTDVNTGEVEVIEEDNLVTNALNDIINTSSDIMFADRRTPGVLNQFYPIYNHLLGGVVLFPEELDEDPDKYWAPTDLEPTGFAGLEVNKFTETRRGDYNVNESHKTADGKGFTYVWDFKTSQANGKIASVCLTHPRAGYSWHGVLDVTGDFSGNSKYARCVAIASDVRDWSVSTYDEEIRKFGDFSTRKVLLSKTTGCLYMVYQGNIRSVRCIPTSNIGLLCDVPVDKASRSYNVYNEEAKVVVDFTDSTFYKQNLSEMYFAISDTEILGVRHNNNTSGNAEVWWIKIDVTTNTYTEGKWSIPTLLMDAQGCATYSEGYIYWFAATTRAVARFQLSNPTNLIHVPLPDEAPFVGPDNGTPQRAALFSTPSGVVYGFNFYICGSVAHATVRYGDGDWSDFGYGRCKSGLLTKLYALGTSYYAWNQDFYTRCNYLLQPQYLATINNLSSPVIKTADKTMKITYTIREVD